MRSRRWQWCGPLTVARCGGWSGWGRTLAVCSLLKCLSWSPVMAQMPPIQAPLVQIPRLQTSLSCLESSPECLATLTERAIANSAEIQAIEERLELTEDRADYARSRRWTNYLTLDPVALVQNLLGGGQVQRDRLDIAQIELRQADLLRRREEVATELAEDILAGLLQWERLGRELEILDGQLVTQRQRQQVMESAYRVGRGSTTSMLAVWQRTEDAAARREERRISRAQVLRELETIVGE